MINVIAVIPHYNHSEQVGFVLQQLLALKLPVMVVDDGSAPKHRERLAQLAAQENIQVIFRPQNGGKGAAMKTGFAAAQAQGFTHVLQLDADGQHNLADTPRLLERCLAHPQAMICGQPIYGKDAPKVRLHGRKITNFWNMLHTFSRDIKDGMCGFRIYPLAEIAPILQRPIGEGMDFDIDIIVRAHWQQISLLWEPTEVKYIQDGVSHFHAWRDNWRISKLHSRLFFTMLGRLLQGKPL